MIPQKTLDKICSLLRAETDDPFEVLGFFTSMTVSGACVCFAGAPRLEQIAKFHELTQEMRRLFSEHLEAERLQ